jgi:hypothetical protein
MGMELERSVGLRPDGAAWLPERRAAVGSILLKLAAMGVRIPAETGDEDTLHLAGDLFARYREQARLLSEHLCPADQRIQQYLDGLLAATAVPGPVRLPGETLILDRYGLARELSLPMDAASWRNELVSSYRLDNGVTDGIRRSDPVIRVRICDLSSPLTVIVRFRGARSRCECAFRGIMTAENFSIPDASADVRCLP